jgi:N-acyl-D-aspartate/D-glutamate deacylase
MHDLVIENARVIDGLGGRAIEGGVAIKGGRIAAVGKNLNQPEPAKPGSDHRKFLIL